VEGTGDRRFSRLRKGEIAGTWGRGTVTGEREKGRGGGVSCHVTWISVTRGKERRLHEKCSGLEPGRRWQAVPGLDCPLRQSCGGPAWTTRAAVGQTYVCNEVSMCGDPKVKQGVGMWQGSHDEDMELCNFTVRRNRGCIREIGTILTYNIIKMYFQYLVSVGKSRRFSSLEMKTWLCLQSGTEPTLQSQENSHLVL
jgi:hypothetical protein